MTTKRKLELLSLTDKELDNKVKIQGTIYDRKRKISDKLIKKMNKMVKTKTCVEIAKELGVRSRDVRYHTDPIYRYCYLKNLSGKHTGKDKVTDLNRIAYKRQLILNNKIEA